MVSVNIRRQLPRRTAIVRGKMGRKSGKIRSTRRIKKTKRRRSRVKVKNTPWTRIEILSSSDNQLALKIRMNLASLKTLSMISRSKLIDSEIV